MIDDALVSGVQKIANYRMKRDFPLMGENHFHESDVRMILESLVMILEEHDIQQSTQSSDRKPVKRRSKSLHKVSAK